jgi:hypothetical protein
MLSYIPIWSGSILLLLAALLTPASAPDPYAYPDDLRRPATAFEPAQGEFVPVPPEILECSQYAGKSISSFPLALEEAVDSSGNTSCYVVGCIINEKTCACCQNTFGSIFICPYEQCGSVYCGELGEG